MSNRQTGSHDLWLFLLLLLLLLAVAVLAGWLGRIKFNMSKDQRKK